MAAVGQPVWNAIVGLNSLAATTPTNGPLSVFTYYSTAFDGNDAVTKTTLAVAGNESKLGTFSSWVRFTGGDGANQSIFASLNAGKTVSPLRIYRNAGNNIEVRLYNAAGTIKWNRFTDAAYTVSSGWFHLLVVWDLGNTTATIKINGSVPAFTEAISPTDDVIPYVTGQLFYIGDYDSGTRLDGLLSETWFTTEYQPDASKFTSGGSPISLGANGSTPTGTQPLVYLPNPYGTFQNNVGSGGNFSVSAGALADGGSNKP